MDIEFDISELKDYQRDLVEVAREVDNGKYVKQFLRNTGDKAKRRVIKHARANVVYDPKNNWTVGDKTYEPTGNLFEGQRRGRVYFHRPTNAFAVRVFGGAPGYHTNLLEYGHEIILPNGQHYGRFEGYGFHSSGIEEYEPLFLKDVDKHVVDKIIKRLT